MSEMYPVHHILFDFLRFLCNIIFLPLKDAEDKKKDWVTMMTLKRRQQAEENRIKVSTDIHKI
jgi:hypothetical protein